jgi:hypothetical protein
MSDSEKKLEKNKSQKQKTFFVVKKKRRLIFGYYQVDSDEDRDMHRNK